MAFRMDQKFIDKILLLNAKGMNSAEIGRKVGRTRERVRQILQENKKLSPQAHKKSLDI